MLTINNIISGDFGGYMGLLLGASAISLIELFDWIFYKCFKQGTEGSRDQNTGRTRHRRTNMRDGFENFGSHLSDNFYQEDQNHASTREEREHDNWLFNRQLANDNLPQDNFRMAVKYSGQHGKDVMGSVHDRF